MNGHELRSVTDSRGKELAVSTDGHGKVIFGEPGGVRWHFAADGTDLDDFLRLLMETITEAEQQEGGAP